MAKRCRLSAAQVAQMLQNESTDVDDDSDILEDSQDSEFSDTSQVASSDSDAGDDDDNDEEGSSKDGESETETLSAQWMRDSDASITLQPLLFTVQNVGVQITGINIPDDILEYFELFFTPSLVENIVAETNRYAKEKLQNQTLRARSIWRTWREVTVSEFKAYLGIILQMAMQDRGDIKDFFSTEWIDYTPFYRDVFSRERFLQIHWMLHVQPPSNDPGVEPQTRGRKVSNIVQHMRTKCMELFRPFHNIVIDESTIAFKGRSQYKMYNPQKPHKWGLRVFTLAHCKTGYLCAFEPYYGSDTTKCLPRSDLPFTARVVLHLCSELLQKVDVGDGYHLYTDRYYSGHSLSQELLKLGIHHTGTVMRNRQGLPADIKRNLKMKKHEVIAWSYQNKEMVLAWKDKRIIFMISTYFGSSTEIQQRRAKGGATEEFVKPTAIVEYTRHMGAVDRFDHYCSSYAFTRKSLKWWRKTFYWLLELAVVNSFILYKETNPSDDKITHIRYRKQLIQQLVGEQRAPGHSRRRGRPSTLDKEERLDKRQHFIATFPNKKTKDCMVCSDRKTAGARKKTAYYCETCSRKPGLHVGNCYKKYHTLTKFR